MAQNREGHENCVISADPAGPKLNRAHEKASPQLATVDTQQSVFHKRTTLPIYRKFMQPCIIYEPSFRATARTTDGHWTPFELYLIASVKSASRDPGFIIADFIPKA